MFCLLLKYEISEAVGEHAAVYCVVVKKTNVLVQNFVEGNVFIKEPLKPKFTATGHE